jgi:hypothetical protein
VVTIFLSELGLFTDTQTVKEMRNGVAHGGMVDTENGGF